MAALVGSFVAAQISPASAQLPRELIGQPVVQVEVMGASARTTPAREIGIPIGAPINRALLRATVERLLDSGNWADVQFDVMSTPHQAGVRIQVHLQPRLVLLRIDVSGNEEFEAPEVLRALRVMAGAEIDPADLPQLASHLIETYANRGYEAATATLVLRDTDNPASKVLVVNIDEGPPTQIESIVFVGDSPPADSGVRGAMEIDEGDRLDRDAVAQSAREAERQLHERGYYEAGVRLQAIDHRSPGNVHVSFELHLGPRYRIQVSGHGDVPRDDVLDALQIEEERVTQTRLTLLTSRVDDLLARYGYSDAETRLLPVRPRDPPPGIDAILLVDIHLGSRIVVTERSFPGARHFDEAFLSEQLDAFLADAIDLSSPFDPVDTHIARRVFVNGDEPRRSRLPLHVRPAEVWYESAYDEAAEHIQELYRAAGFLSAEVGPVTLVRDIDLAEAASERSPQEPQESADPDVSAHARIAVFEGPRAHLYSVELTGNSAMTDQDVLLAAGLERNEPFSYLALERAKDLIVRAYKERGFYYASVEADVRFSEDRTRAEVLLRVNERYEVHVSETRIEGADHTDEALVRAVAGVEPGALLTTDLLRRAQERLMDLGVFTGVTIAPLDPELPARSKVIVFVLTERHTQYLDFRIGISTAQGARFGFEYGIRNILGLALEASLRAQFGYQFFFLDNTLEERFTRLSLQDRLERRVVLTLSAPFIGLPDVRASLSLSNLRENERNFGLDANTISLSLGWRPHRSLNFTLTGGLENNEIAVLGGESYDEILNNTRDLRLRGLLRVPEGESTLVAVSLSSTIDRRDNPFTPTRGFYATGSLEWAKTTSGSVVEREGLSETFESHHLRLQLSGSGYLPLGGGVVFAAQVRFGRMVHLDNNSQTYPNRKFFLGGVDTVRGYLQDALVPQDIADEVCDPDAAGCALPADFNINAVVQGGDVFLVLRAELRFPIFGSLHGGLFLDLGNSWVNAAEINPIRLRPTTGIGLRIATPVGPIAFDYGFLLARRRFLDEPIGSFHFSIGLF